MPTRKTTSTRRLSRAVSPRSRRRSARLEEGLLPVVDVELPRGGRRGRPGRDRALRARAGRRGRWEVRFGMGAGANERTVPVSLGKPGERSRDDVDVPTTLPRGRRTTTRRRPRSRSVAGNPSCLARSARRTGAGRSCSASPLRGLRSGRGGSLPDAAYRVDPKVEETKTAGVGRAAMDALGACDGRPPRGAPPLYRVWIELRRNRNAADARRETAGELRLAGIAADRMERGIAMPARPFRLMNRAVARALRQRSRRARSPRSRLAEAFQLAC